MDFVRTDKRKNENLGRALHCSLVAVIFQKEEPFLPPAPPERLQSCFLLWGRKKFSDEASLWLRGPGRGPRPADLRAEPPARQAGEPKRLGGAGRWGPLRCLRRSVPWAAFPVGPVCGIFPEETLCPFLTVSAPALTTFHCWDAGRV